MKKNDFINGLKKDLKNHALKVTNIHVDKIK